ncbi:site-specific integrase [Lactobacillus delbrueckii subsp. lactis]|jgi:integrase|uniref:site-specific integrase n=1 Tax=Lactobacillales TaxID=186826 RepID=UPI0001DC9735|nr:MULTISPECIES: site-specific integrase [Lactobacillales]ADQ61014.1 Integrase [Lactobacillus delbrueckii subsp. bulgaricus ND02]EFK31377.1 site-specific recombinase, phage integrase family [Lactobacillus delbrueckii subsp. bulgaricus PB2003/044-T3-4]MBD5836242.1 site-specific integrase [Lactobacillus delbrueckii]MBM6986406.1 site-specific integrase [Lactobacillus delbrueckii]MBO3082317.1 site-specific integrase [Lactobacillus delbrueckii subsp. bulgaricus]
MRKKQILLHDYFAQWIEVYKDGAVRERTLDKYWLSHRHLQEIAPNLKLVDITRLEYQQILNTFAQTHEKATVMDFHHQLKAMLLDAYDEGYIQRDPTRKIVVKGKEPSEKKSKYLNEFELKLLLRHLDLSTFPNFDWMILLIAKTGLRFSEALGLTKEDIDLEQQTINVDKTWDYKSYTGSFKQTKNASSVRKVPIDWKLAMQLNQVIQDLPNGEPIFAQKRVFNSTVNNLLKKHCEELNIPVISVHGLRHTHASLLLFAGVSIASVARRLGHADMTTTQQTYLHIIQELENKDNTKIMQHLAAL